MSESEKLTALRDSISPDDESDDILFGLLSTAEAMILNRLYPFQTEAVAMPPRYDRIQIQLAVELYTQRGAEGQASHTENGMTRTWPSANRLLASIMPMCGSVV